MEKSFPVQTLIAFFLGICIGAGLGYLFLPNTMHHHSTHPIADPFDTAYHAHADFHIFIGDQQVDLTDDRFMTTGSHQVSKQAHLHDGNGEIKHIHTENFSFADFLESLDITLTPNCLTLFSGEPMCSEENQAVMLYVNQELYTEPLTKYVPTDDDRILLYYGDPQNENIQTYIEEIPSDSCYYSGTCPERGVAPPESCGLTCEL